MIYGSGPLVPVAGASVQSLPPPIWTKPGTAHYYTKPLLLKLSNKLLLKSKKSTKTPLKRTQRPPYQTFYLYLKPISPFLVSS